MYRWLSLIVALLGLAVPLRVAGAPPQPTYGTAVIDGQYSEWNLADDYFADMYLGGDQGEPTESRLYLRYDNARAILYALVLCAPTVTGYVGQSTAWIALDLENPKAVSQGSGNDGTPPDFAWVGQSYDGSPQHVRGFEASLWMAPGDHLIVVQAGILNPADGVPAIASIPAGGAEISIPVPAIEIEQTSFGAVRALYR